MRTSRLDRVWREHWAVHALSPVVTADVGELRARFAEFMEANPADPLSCILSDDATRWLPVPAAQREVHATQVIVDGIDLDDTPDPYAVLPAHRPPTGYRPPFRMVVGRRSILFYVNHVIGDVMVITQLTSQLAQGNFVGLIAGARFGVPLLVKMTATQSLVHGRGWMRHRRPAAARDCDGGQDQVIEDADTVAVGVLLDADRYREFKEWRDIHCGDLSVTALMAAATYRAFQLEGLPVAGDGLYVLLDLRRYLPPAYARLPGNMAVSVLVNTALSDPVRISRDLRALIRSAIAIPALLKGVVLQSFSRRLPFGPRRGAGGCGNSVRMTFNSMQRNPGIATIPWLDRSRARYMGMSYPIAPNGISVFACIVDDRMEFSASFRSDVLDRAAVQRALNRLQDMPGLLE